MISRVGFASAGLRTNRGGEVRQTRGKNRPLRSRVRQRDAEMRQTTAFGGAIVVRSRGMRNMNFRIASCIMQSSVPCFGKLHWAADPDKVVLHKRKRFFMSLLGYLQSVHGVQLVRFLPDGRHHATDSLAKANGFIAGDEQILTIDYDGVAVPMNQEFLSILLKTTACEVSKNCGVHAYVRWDKSMEVGRVQHGQNKFPGLHNGIDVLGWKQAIRTGSDLDWNGVQRIAGLDELGPDFRDSVNVRESFANGKMNANAWALLIRGLYDRPELRDSSDWRVTSGQLNGPCPFCGGGPNSNRLRIDFTDRGQGASFADPIVECRTCGREEWNRQLVNKLGRSPFKKQDRRAKRSRTEFRKSENRHPEWLCEGEILTKAATLIAGQPKVGKTTFCVNRLACAVTGRWPNGDESEPGNVLIHAKEDDYESVLRPMLEIAGVQDPDSRVARFQEDEFDLLNDDFTSVTDVPDLRMIYFDNALDLGVSDDNEARSARAVALRANELARRAECAVMLTKHFRKSSAGSGGGLWWEMVAGSGQWTAVFRSIMLMFKNKENRRILKFGNLNYGEVKGWDIELAGGFTKTRHPKKFWNGHEHEVVMERIHEKKMKFLRPVMGDSEAALAEFFKVIEEAA